MKRLKKLKTWAATTFAEKPRENTLEIDLNRHQPSTIQVDHSIAKKQAKTRKLINQELQKMHQFAAIPHEVGCHILHDTNPRLDCTGQCNFKHEPDKMGPTYEVQRATKLEWSINAVRESDTKFDNHKGKDGFGEIE